MNFNRILISGISPSAFLWWFFKSDWLSYICQPHLRVHTDKFKNASCHVKETSVEGEKALFDNPGKAMFKGQWGSALAGGLTQSCYTAAVLVKEEAAQHLELFSF